MTKLTSLKVKSADAGRHHDGDGLMMSVKPSRTRSWVLRVMKDGKRSEIGLGSYPIISLAEARTAASSLLAAAEGGADVLAARRAAKANEAEAVERTFAKIAAMAHEQRSFKTPQLSRRWINRLKTYAYPHLGNMPIDRVEAADVVRVLQPLWSTKHETAVRVRQLVEVVLKFAHARQWRGPVPSLAALTKDAFAPYNR